MKQFKYEFFAGIVFLVLFFIIETFSRNEFLLTALVLLFGILFMLFPSDKKVKITLWSIGVIFGTVIEVVMGFWGRSQFWSYGSLFGVPLWLPFIWGFGFEAIYILGKWIDKEKIVARK